MVSSGRATGQQPTPKPPDAARSAAETLNTATRQQLLSVYGIGPVLADRIIQNRPYAAAYDVVEKGIIPESIFVQLRKHLLDEHSA
jgi:DNA uptake protein ComE-like DNA-binding protein